MLCLSYHLKLYFFNLNQQIYSLRNFIFGNSKIIPSSQIVESSDTIINSESDSESCVISFNEKKQKVIFWIGDIEDFDNAGDDDDDDDDDNDDDNDDDDDDNDDDDDDDK